MLVRPSLLVTAIGFASSVYAWGQLGHKTVANVAIQFLQDEALARVEDILARDGHKRSPNPTLVDVATWADTFGNSGTGKFSKPFHFINAQNDDIPFECHVDLARGDCNNDECVVTAISNYTQQLLGPSRNVNDTADALKFLVHFIGDITQPLHTEATARGGTRLDIRWRGGRKDLHSVWDTDMITAFAGTDTPENMEAWTATIVNDVTNGRYKDLVSEWLKCTDIDDSLNCALEWANDSNFFICDYVLKTDPEGKELSGDYFRGAVPIIEEQVAKGGVRMAVWFNQLFGSGQPGRLPPPKNRLVVQDMSL